MSAEDNSPDSPEGKPGSKPETNQEDAELDQATATAEASAAEEGSADSSEGNAGDQEDEQIRGLKDQLLRQMAEVENVKRRASRDVENAHKFATEKLLSEMFPVLDSLEKAVETASATEGAEAIAEGVELSLKLFVDTLGKNGVEQIDLLVSTRQPQPVVRFTGKGGVHPGPRVIDPATSADGGKYSVRVSNSFGSTTSDEATLTITGDDSSCTNQPPAFVTQPVSQTVTACNSVTFTSSVNGTRPFTYKWSKDGIMIADATESMFTIDQATLADAGAYTLTVSNSFGEVTSTAATLTVTGDDSACKDPTTGSTKVFLPVIVR